MGVELGSIQYVPCPATLTPCPNCVKGRCGLYAGGWVRRGFMRLGSKKSPERGGGRSLRATNRDN